MSRLIAPRQLEKFRDWIACVVPAFRAGAEAGLTGSPSTTTLSYAWSAGAGSVTLPVYDYWTFSTGPDGDSKHWPSVSPLSAPEARWVCAASTRPCPAMEFSRWGNTKVDENGWCEAR